MLKWFNIISNGNFHHFGDGRRWPLTEFNAQGIMRQTWSNLSETLVQSQQ